MATFNPSEIYQFAIKIEENGEKFYRTMVDKLENDKVIELFTHLAKEEVRHKVTFQKLLSGFEDYRPPESYQDEYFQYLQAYAENLVFNFEKFETDMVKVESLEDAFQYAIGKELDTIAYFREMKELVPVGEKDKIESILEEERRHVVLLTEMKKEVLN
ncbi:MAG: ferritin family protein [Candidatus Marinimicrobia bacterium]|nr:ferritin family protein [Candidatus Neomarinimicrobiota bacterium]